MSLDDLVVFERVVREGSFTAAATALGLAKSTVSARVARLEERLDVRLLERTTRSLRPTEDGALFYERCVRVVDEAREAEEALLTRRESPHGTLRVTCPRLFGYAFLNPVIAAFLERHTAVRVELTLAERMVDLVEEGFDLALRIGRPPDSSLVARRLGQAPMLFAASPAYLGRAGTPSGVDDLGHHDAIVVSRGGPTAWPVRDGETIRTIPVGGRFHVNSLVMARDAAMHGVGVAFLPAFLAAEGIARGLLVPVLPDHAPPPMPVHALYPSRRHLTARVRAFIDLLVETTAASPPWEP